MRTDEFRIWYQIYCCALNLHEGLKTPTPRLWHPSRRSRAASRVQMAARPSRSHFDFEATCNDDDAIAEQF